MCYTLRIGGVTISRSKIAKGMCGLVLICALIPNNLFSYATSDISYVETVSSTIDVQNIEFSDGISSESEDAMEDSVVTDIAEVLGMEVNDEDTYSLVFGEELAKYNIIYKYDEDEEELNNKFKDLHELTTAELGETNIVEVPTEEYSEEQYDEQYEEQETTTEEQDITEEEEEQLVNTEEESKNELEIQFVDQSDALLEIDSPDEDYKGAIVELTDDDRYILEHLVMGEAGGEGMIGAALVAQAIRDTMVYKGFDSVESVRKALKYSGSLSKEPNQDVIDAVSFIFDQGGCAVKSTIFYFYAPKRVTSSWHENQRFVVEYGGHRFFTKK
jgi:hypothetical protein